MFNPQKPFGKFCPPWRGVAFEQNGRYYTADHREVDQDGRPLADIIEVENGKSGDDYGSPEPGKAKNGNHDIGPVIPISDLLATTNMPFMAFKKAARAHLGEDTPALKADIITALKAKEAASQPPPKHEAPAPSQASKETVASNGVDIVAWVDKRVMKQYLMGDVYKAIRELTNKVVSNERDAVNHLIDEGYIPAEYARNAGSGLTWEGVGGQE